MSNLDLKKYFKIDKSYTIRNKILETLYRDQEDSKDCEKRVTSKTIADATGVSLGDLHFYHELLKENDEIDCCEEGGLHKMFIKENGRYAYLDKKYIKEGRKLYWDFWYDPIKVVAPFISIIVAVMAVYFNSATGAKFKSMQEQIDAMKSQGATNICHLSR